MCSQKYDNVFSLAKFCQTDFLPQRKLPILYIFYLILTRESCNCKRTIWVWLWVLCLLHLSGDVCTMSTTYNGPPVFLWYPGGISLEYCWGHMLLTASMSTNTVVMSWNFKGLKDPNMCYALFTTLNYFGSAVVCLQETHLTKDTTNFLKSEYYLLQYHSTC